MDAHVGTPATRSGDDQAVMTILFALSFSHLVNDTIQSLVPSVYPILKTSFHLDFGQIGLITLAFQLTASFLQPVVGFVTDKRPQPYSLAHRHGVQSLRPDHVVARGKLRDHPRLRLDDRHRLVDLSSGGVPHRARGIGWPLRLRAVAVPGRRLFRLGCRAVAGRLHRRPVRAALDRLVRAHRLRRHRDATDDRALVCRAPRRAARQSKQAHRPGRPVATDDRRHRGDPAGARVLEIRLHGEHLVVLHLLPHPQIRGFGSDCAAVPVRLPRRHGGGHLLRWPDRRQVWTARGDLGVDPRQSCR